MTQTDHLENDLYAAAFLLAVGVPLTDIRPVGSRCVFVFDNADGQASNTARGYTGGATIPAREFAAAIIQTKTMLYETKFQNSKGTQTERNDTSRHSYR
jgi:hypothetical protein